jgi:hypothetical protein
VRLLGLVLGKSRGLTAQRTVPPLGLQFYVPVFSFLKTVCAWTSQPLRPGAVILRNSINWLNNTGKQTSASEGDSSVAGHSIPRDL